MGRPAQKRLVRKRFLERELSKIETLPIPKTNLEQYTTPSRVAAGALYLAAYVYDDIINKTILDLGCGTGMLSIGAALLCAKEVFGVDIDRASISLAQKNAKKLGVEEQTNWIVADIDVIKGDFETIIQNPPFGVQKRGADRVFITKSLELGKIIYSFHKSGSSNRKFIKRFIEEHGGKITTIFPMKMDIPRIFKFHTKTKRIVQVDLYRMEGKR